MSLAEHLTKEEFVKDPDASKGRLYNFLHGKLSGEGLMRLGSVTSLAVTINSVVAIVYGTATLNLELATYGLMLVPPVLTMNITSLIVGDSMRVRERLDYLVNS